MHCCVVIGRLWQIGAAWIGEFAHWGRAEGAEFFMVHSCVFVSRCCWCGTLLGAVLAVQPYLSSRPGLALLAQVFSRALLLTMHMMPHCGCANDAYDAPLRLCKRSESAARWVNTLPAFVLYSTTQLQRIGG